MSPEWSGAWKFLFQTSSKVMLKLLLLGSSADNHCSRGLFVFVTLGKTASISCNSRSFGIWGQNTLIAIQSHSAQYGNYTHLASDFSRIPISPLILRSPVLCQDLPLSTLAWKGHPSVSFSTMSVPPWSVHFLVKRFCPGPPWRIYSGGEFACLHSNTLLFPEPSDPFLITLPSKFQQNSQAIVNAGFKQWY